MKFVTAIHRPLQFLCQITTLMLVLPAVAHATFLPKNKPVPGGVALIEIEAPAGVANVQPSASYNQRPVMLVADEKKAGKWIAVTGISLETEPGPQQLKVVWGDKEELVPFRVKKHKYKTQYLKLKSKKHVDLSKEDLDRHLSEKKKIVAALQHWSEQPALNEKVMLPVTGRMSSPFGLRRYFNNEPRKAHSGIDIAAPLGTPILSPLDGTVIDVGNYFFNGNSIFIDHGQGLVTMYCHMSKVNVKQGQKVKRGQRIGAVGKTGRATGPHLHWAISINDTRVDPGLFFKDISKAIRKKRR